MRQPTRTGRTIATMAVVTLLGCDDEPAVVEARNPRLCVEDRVLSPGLGKPSPRPAEPG